MRVSFAREHFAERRETRGHRDAVGVVRSAVKDFVLRDQVHHRAARSEGTQRQTTTDGFGQADHVRLHAKKFAGAAPSKLRSGFDLVEDQQCAVFGANVPQALQESGLRHAQANVHQDGFENDRGNLAGIFTEPPLDAAEIVETRDDDIGEGSFWNAPPPGTELGASASPQSSALGLTLTSARHAIRGKNPRT